MFKNYLIKLFFNQNALIYSVCSALFFKLIICNKILLSINFSKISHIFNYFFNVFNFRFFYLDIHIKFNIYNS